MPELPEVEVIKIFLEDKLLNQKIVSLDILNAKSFIGDPKDIINKKIIRFTRIGKQLSIHLNNGKIMLVHLKMTGQLLYLPPLSRGGPEGGGVFLGHPTKSFNQKSTRLKFNFSDSSILFFNDQRKFGWIKIYNNQSELSEDQKNLGHDIFDDKFTPDYLYSQLQRSKAPIKSILLDQHFFAGIGNIYANDALFLSKIHPSNPSNKIQRTSVLALHNNLLLIMRQSVLAGGSTMKDNKYIRPDGSFGNNQFFFRVYQRAGEPCLVCKTKIKRIVVGGRGTFFCPKCQKSSL
jgi:formamidopyrimidine-DNA glycosylase